MSFHSSCFKYCNIFEKAFYRHSGYKTVSVKHQTTQRFEPRGQHSLHFDKTQRLDSHQRTKTAFPLFHYNEILFRFDCSPNCGWRHSSDHPLLLMYHTGTAHRPCLPAADRWSEKEQTERQRRQNPRSCSVSISTHWCYRRWLIYIHNWRFNTHSSEEQRGAAAQCVCNTMRSTECVPYFYYFSSIFTWSH